ncbi:hypothetical protein [Flavobacterium psychrotolerans]|uniref:DUF2892 domain-containing protein n=1 Tax=Flavobacterium psychrotolerans TaxID=2169410 RepID=A0A2U1JPT7_9FLAO|nr:hypothetical protein [Flavobacterium psychrotolerans]PWA07187.1 hypothetical protein DB895_00225 [Flavobacterium psychrotolerans]
MKVQLFTNWHLMRWVRLTFALFLFIQAIVLREWMFITFGLFFFIQVIFNLGCGANDCTIPNHKNKKDE